jgi:NAD+ synthase
MQTSAIIDHIVNWLGNYAKQANAQGFIIGISGGIDSALTSTLCAKTGLKTIAVSMPIHQKPDQLTRANMHMDWLKLNFSNVETLEVDLSPTFDTMRKSFPQNTGLHHLSMANTRSRLRMVTLYAIGQSNGCLVAGTGNKIEDFGVGFFTKYGDGGVDLSPIADLTKTQVYHLCKHLHVIQSIQEAKPTDGLWDIERTDEEQLGATYPELEWAMHYLEKNPDFTFDHAGTDLSIRQLETLDIYLKFHKANKHKMVAIPVCTIPQNLLIAK